MRKSKTRSSFGFTIILCILLLLIPGLAADHTDQAIPGAVDGDVMVMVKAGKGGGVG